MKKFAPLIILAGCAALFFLGVVQLFEWRFKAGDVYPAYSTLRADPLGAMAIYESLEKMPGLAVRRDFSSDDRLPEERGTVYLQLGAKTYEWGWLPEDTYREIKNYLGGGGRLVIACFPRTGKEYHFDPDEDETNLVKSAQPKAKNTNSPPLKVVKKKRKITSPDGSWVDLWEDWGLHFDYQELPQADDVYQPVVVHNASHPELPRSLLWHSGTVFTNVSAKWHTVYARGTNAVVLERSFGKGSVVIASDSYFLSNEAMSQDRHADLLAWIIGPGTNVVFDESHFGIVESPGVASLMRRYRLQGLAAGLLLLAGLFIWKNAAGLAPPHVEEPREDFVAGKDSASGFVNLLRRNIPPREIFGVCFSEWKKSAAPAGSVSQARLRQAEAIFKEDSARPPAERNPLATYHKISETLGPRKNSL